MRDIFSYIAYTLMEPETAKRLTRRIMDEIEGLDAFPMRYPVYPHEPWHSFGMRHFPVGNYLVFYFPKEKSETVFILRIMYGGRDIQKQLGDSPKPEL